MGSDATGRADLHVHTTASDGDFSPARVVAMAAAAGLAALAIADHNTVAGVEEGLRAGEAAGLKVIPAVELNAAHAGLEPHLLGYFVDHRDPVFQARLAEAEREWLRALRGRAARMRALGFPVKDEDVLEIRPEGGYVLKSLLEALLRADPGARDPRLDPYRKADLAARLAFSQYYQSPDGAAYAPAAALAADEAIALIQGVGGVPVLAHPGTVLRAGEGAGALEPLLRQLVDLGLAGVEAYSSYHSAGFARELRDLARRLGLGLTAGSDFHGPSLKPGLELGQVAGDRHEVLDWLERAAAKEESDAGEAAEHGDPEGRAARQDEGTQGP